MLAIMEPLIIQINWVYFLGLIGALIVVAYYSGARFSGIETSITWIKESITKLEGRMDNTFASASPVKLLPKGVEILNSSGIKEYIDRNKEHLITKCNFTGLKNQYDIQEKAFECFSTINFGDFEDKIKESAFKFGMSLETIRRIGGIYFRDILLTENGFTPEDLDKPKK